MNSHLVCRLGWRLQPWPPRDPPSREMEKSGTSRARAVWELSGSPGRPLWCCRRCCRPPVRSCRTGAMLSHRVRRLANVVGIVAYYVVRAAGGECRRDERGHRHCRRAACGVGAPACPRRYAADALSAACCARGRYAMRSAHGAVLQYGRDAVYHSVDFNPPLNPDPAATELIWLHVL